MNRKIVDIIVFTLLIATALSTVGTITVQTTSSIGEVKDQYQEQCDECEFFKNYASKDY